MRRTLNTDARGRKGGEHALHPHLPRTLGSLAPPLTPLITLHRCVCVCVIYDIPRKELHMFTDYTHTSPTPLPHLPPSILFALFITFHRWV